MPDLVVAGAGMAGLVAAARARELGADVVVYEKGDRPGGSMLLSSGVVWRYREWERFRKECPGGEPQLQRLVWERLDDDLAWLESLGAAVVGRESGNPLTTGLQLDPGKLTETLASQGGELRLREPLAELPEGVPVILATGGFQGNTDLVRQHITSEAPNLVLRANPWSAGDGLRPARSGVCQLRQGREPPRRSLRAAHLVGDRRRPVDGASARRTCSLHRSRRCARGTRPRPNRCRPDRGRPPGGRSRRAAERRDRRRGGRRHHDDARRHPDRRAGASRGRYLCRRRGCRRDLDRRLVERPRLSTGARKARRRGRYLSHFCCR